MSCFILHKGHIVWFQVLKWNLNSVTAIVWCFFFYNILYYSHFPDVLVLLGLKATCSNGHTPSFGLMESITAY